MRLDISMNGDQLVINNDEKISNFEAKWKCKAVEYDRHQEELSFEIKVNFPHLFESYVRKCRGSESRC